jgi:putative alpha-1,2-mannosidase
MDLGEGKTLTVIADNYAPDNIYVDSVSLNGKVLDRTYFTHDEIASGGELRFVMTHRDSVAP